jgi:hypothetical protein
MNDFHAKISEIFELEIQNKFCLEYKHKFA